MSYDFYRFDKKKPDNKWDYTMRRPNGRGRKDK